MYLKQSVAFLTKLQLKQHLNIISVIIICISFVILIISPPEMAGGSIWQEFQIRLENYAGEQTVLFENTA